MDKGGIVTAEYWTALPPQEAAAADLLYLAAKERVARRALGPDRDDEDDE